jgi:glycerol kinase
MRVDGAMAANDWLCQFLADMLQTNVERPAQLETTALGVAFHAGLATGLWDDVQALAQTWTLERRFEPRMSADQRRRLIDGWRAAVARTLTGFLGAKPGPI